MIDLINEKKLFFLSKNYSKICASNTINSFDKGNFLAFAFGHVSGWATINFVDLQSENGIFPSRPLTLEEASLVVSIVNIGGFLGNFTALPIIHRFGIKRTIHICGVPIIVRDIKNV